MFLKLNFLDWMKYTLRLEYKLLGRCSFEWPSSTCNENFKNIHAIYYHRDILFKKVCDKFQIFQHRDCSCDFINKSQYNKLMRGMIHVMDLKRDIIVPKTPRDLNGCLKQI